MDDSCDGAINLEEFSKLVPGFRFFLLTGGWLPIFFFWWKFNKVKVGENPGNSAS